MPCSRQMLVEACAHDSGPLGRRGSRQVGELDAVVGQHGVDLVGHGCDQGLAGSVTLSADAAFSMQLDEGELRGPVDGHEEIELALLGAHLGDVDVEVADRIALELLLGRLVAVDLRQAADAVALQAAMQRRAGQMRDRRPAGHRGNRRAAAAYACGRRR